MFCSIITSFILAIKSHHPRHHLRNVGWFRVESYTWTAGISSSFLALELLCVNSWAGFLCTRVYFWEMYRRFWFVPVRTSRPSVPFIMFWILSSTHRFPRAWQFRGVLWLWSWRCNSSTNLSSPLHVKIHEEFFSAKWWYLHLNTKTKQLWKTYVQDWSNSGIRLDRCKTPCLRILTRRKVISAYWNDIVKQYLLLSASWYMFEFTSCWKQLKILKCLMHSVLRRFLFSQIPFFPAFHICEVDTELSRLVNNSIQQFYIGGYGVFAFLFPHDTTIECFLWNLSPSLKPFSIWLVITTTKPLFFFSGSRECPMSFHKSQKHVLEFLWMWMHKTPHFLSCWCLCVEHGHKDYVSLNSSGSMWVLQVALDYLAMLWSWDFLPLDLNWCSI